MEERRAVQEGWLFAAKLAGADAGAQLGSAYVGQVEDAIKQLSEDIIKLKSGQRDAVLGGYIAEHWHADTFNIDAIAAGSKHRAFTLGSTEYASIDIDTNFGTSYSSKYMATAEDSAVAQAAVARETGLPKYQGQERLIPTDHMEEAVKAAGRRAAKNASTRPETASAYQDAADHMTDRISDGKGIESKPLSKKDDLKMARDVKQDKFDPENYGVSVDNAIKAEYIVKQAVKAGCTAAAITVAMQMAPEIYKAIDYLVKHGELDLQQLKRMGSKAISAGAEGFLRGSISCSVLIMCEKGLLGNALKGADPTLVGSVVAIVLDTIKNSILVAAGKMTPREMGSALVDGVVVSAGYIAGAKIGGLIGQALGFELPVVGYLIGSLVGCAFAVVYNVGKKKLISFCVDTGFTCFGLVEQDYTIPESVLNEMGIDTISIPRVNVKKTDVRRVSVQADVNRVNYETIDITFLRRGIIGVNRVGYVT